MNEEELQKIERGDDSLGGVVVMLVASVAMIAFIVYLVVRVL